MTTVMTLWGKEIRKIKLLPRGEIIEQVNYFKCIWNDIKFVQI